MITLEKFKKNISFLHLAHVSGNEDLVLSTYKAILSHFPNKKEEIEHFCWFLNFGMLEGQEISIEDFYSQLQ